MHVVAPTPENLVRFRVIDGMRDAIAHCTSTEEAWAIWDNILEPDNCSWIAWAVAINVFEFELCDRDDRMVWLDVVFVEPSYDPEPFVLDQLIFRVAPAYMAYKQLLTLEELTFLFLA